MPGLQVLSAPSNQPTLNAVVQPVQQPSLAPRVLPAPQNQPSLATRVQSQPAGQPSLNPVVQSQPQAQSDITTIGTADAQQPFTPKLSVDEFAQLIKQKYPQYADQDNGTLVKAILDKHPEYTDRVYIPISAVQDKHPGIVQSLIQGVVKPFARVGVTIAGGAAAAYEGAGALGDYIAGDQAGGQQHAKKAADILDAGKTGADLGYLGKTKAITKPGLDAAGVGAEIAANFIGGEGAVGAGESLLKGSLKTAIKTGIKEGATAGAVAGFGGGLQKDKVTVKSLAEDTAIGGATGAVVGGAAAGIPAAGVEAVRFVKGVKNFISPDVEVALTKAIKPASRNFGFKDALQTAIPDIYSTAQQHGIELNSVESLGTAINQAKKGVWQEYQGLLGPNAKATIDGGPIADKMLSAIDKRFRLQNPGAAEAIEKVADTYRRQIPLSEAEDFLQSANNDLNGYYAKNKVGQKVALGDPEKAYVVHEAEGLRAALYSKLDELTGKSAAAIKQRYGALSNIETDVAKRINVAARQNPDSLAEQIGMAQGIASIGKSVLNRNFGDAVSGGAQIAASHYFKNKNTSDALVETAFRKFAKSLKKFPSLKR
jgi:hypothetical protein